MRPAAWSMSVAGIKGAGRSFSIRWPRLLGEHSPKEESLASIYGYDFFGGSRAPSQSEPQHKGRGYMYRQIRRPADASPAGVRCF